MSHQSTFEVLFLAKLNRSSLRVQWLSVTCLETKDRRSNIRILNLHEETAGVSKFSTKLDNPLALHSNRRGAATCAAHNVALLS